MDEMKSRIRNCCLEKEAAPCISACPFSLDIREFVPRVERGAFNLAYRLYANAVAFPRIVAEICDERCRLDCPRSGIDGAVNLKLIERAVVAGMVRREPNSYNMPAKDKNIAIVGGGISALACALRLANRKYAVTVFEKRDRIGGHLWDIMPPEIFLKDIEEQFSKEKYSLLLNTEVRDLENIRKKYDAVYVATGKGGGSFDLPEEAAPGDVMAAAEGLFVGGSILGVSSAEAVAHGLRAASLIEGYIKTGNMKGPEPRIPTKIKLELKDVAAAAPVSPSVDGGYTEDEARREAGRCIKCRCDVCVRSCDMMAYFQKFPKLIEEEVHITVNPGTLDGNGTVATRLISTCNQCGLCGKVCPEQIDVGKFMRESHRAMREKNAMPWAFHEFWLNDMAFSRSERASFFYVPSGEESSRENRPPSALADIKDFHRGQTDGCVCRESRPPSASADIKDFHRGQTDGCVCRYLFFPGCQMGASDPRYVTETYRLLRKHLPDTAIFVTCCGAPALWSGDGNMYDDICREIEEKWRQLGMPDIIFGCPTCREMIREALPQIKGTMVSDVLYELGVKTAAGGGEISLFDPCSARNYPETRQKVRMMLTEAGYLLKPLEYEGERAKCCSWGGQISIANPPYARWLIDKRISEKPVPYVVYCTNCRDIFAEAGKPVLHILDLILGLGGWDKRPPTYSKRRRNRELVKESLMKELLNEEMPPEKDITLLISQELEAKLHREKILEDDLAAVISFCEQTGRKLFNPKNGHFTGYHEIGHMTCWVEYHLEGDGYRVYNAYSHRMKIELEEVWHGRKQKLDL